MPTHSHGYGPKGRVTKGPVDLLVCFAVVEEMKFFAPRRARTKGAPAPLPCQVCLTGIGRRNAALSIREAIGALQPKRVITAGFAGGLNPALRTGTVIYEDDDADFGPELEDLGAVKGRFYCHKRGGDHGAGEGGFVEGDGGGRGGDGVVGDSDDLPGVWDSECDGAGDFG